jgi:hypothetical protein
LRGDGVLRVGVGEVRGLAQERVHHEVGGVGLYDGGGGWGADYVGLRRGVKE